MHRPQFIGTSWLTRSAADASGHSAQRFHAFTPWLCESQNSFHSTVVGIWNNFRFKKNKLLILRALSDASALDWICILQHLENDFSFSFPFCRTSPMNLLLFSDESFFN